MNKYTHVVQYYETDKMGITHHSNYVRWMEEARVDFLDRIGYSFEKLEAEGVISPVIAIECKYKLTTTFADTVSIAVSLCEFNGIKLKLKYIMTNEENKTVFEGVSEHCFLGRDGNILRIKKEMPDFYETLSALVEK